MKIKKLILSKVCIIGLTYLLVIWSLKMKLIESSLFDSGLEFFLSVTVHVARKIYQLIESVSKSFDFISSFFERMDAFRRFCCTNFASEQKEWFTVLSGLPKLHTWRS